ncbi:hypothetical protein H632_c1087p1 [Helicosporidium sp. ATCC 50920]|nr:hypothetical protein H632_c1087p1 [Helicosporidium sp. ATCC 50920]|eukprot:KDD74768.1 hypothetical protein H632_c1087p1 [Helicosporidium sp. ATCC 50920]
MSTSIRPPKSGEPAELQFYDLLAVFHELGHVLEILLNRDSEVLIAGTTNLPLDFSECKLVYVLKADERVVQQPLVYCRRPLMLLRQIYLSKMDLSLHSTYTASATDKVLDHRHEVADKTLVLPYSSKNCDFCDLMPCFGYEHGSNYYSYLWSEIYSADAMGYFEEVGTLNDTQKFRGRPVSMHYFLKQLSSF